MIINTKPIPIAIYNLNNTSNDLNVEGTIIIKLNVSSTSTLIGQNICVKITNNTVNPAQPTFGGYQILVVSAKLATPDSCNNSDLL